MARKSSVRTGTATTTAALLVPARSNRVALVFFPSATSTQQYTVSDSPSVVAGKGILVAGTLPAVALDGAVVGDVVQKPLYVICPTATVDFGFIEVLDA
jgi:hypothetical protein